MYDLSHLVTEELRNTWGPHRQRFNYIIYVLVLDWSFLEEIQRYKIDAVFIKGLRIFTAP